MIPNIHVAKQLENDIRIHIGHDRFDLDAPVGRLELAFGSDRLGQA